MSETSTTEVHCGDCDAVLDAAPNEDALRRKPCPSCGSKRRLVKANLEGRLELRISLRYVQKGERPGIRGRRLVEGRTGESQSSDGTWASVEQVVDRINRRYRKLVRTADGKVIRDVDEPLEEHQGYDSAKRPDRTGD